MKIRFWGVRGSIPSPGAHTQTYGGNTTCIEVRPDDDTLIILDAGTGIFPLAQPLLRRMPVQANIFITHTHWDHIQGLPFFTPLYIPGNTVRIHGARDVVTGAGMAVKQIFIDPVGSSFNIKVETADGPGGVQFERLDFAGHAVDRNGEIVRRKVQRRLEVAVSMVAGE